MQQKRLAIAVAIAVALPCAAHAQSALPSWLKLSGFGTAGAVSTDTDLARYATSVLQPGGAGKSADFGVDSLLAGQADVRASDALGFTLQLVSNRTADDNYKPHVEWAFARYALAPDLALRGGILAVPVYLQSDSRLVGFANPWVRPPTALYSQAPLTNFRGVDLAWRPSIGDVSITLQPYAGIARPEVPDTTGGSVTAHLDQLRGVSLSAETGPWTVRAGYFQTQFTYQSASVAQLIGGLRSVAALLPGAGVLADQLDPTDKRITFSAVGASYDSGRMLVQAEYARRKADFFLADTTAWYATAGYRFGNVMPHLTISRARTDSPTTQSLVPAAGPLLPLAIGVNTLLAGQNPAQKTIAAGVRWQFARNADVKLQWDRVDLPSGAVGNFNSVQPGFAGSRVNVYSAAVDFVF